MVVVFGEVILLRFGFVGGGGGVRSADEMHLWVYSGQTLSLVAKVLKQSKLRLNFQYKNVSK